MRFQKPYLLIACGNISHCSWYGIVIQGKFYNTFYSYLESALCLKPCLCLSNRRHDFAIAIVNCFKFTECVRSKYVICSRNTVECIIINVG